MIETRAQYQVGLKRRAREPWVQIVLLQIPVEVAHPEHQKQSPAGTSHSVVRLEPEAAVLPHHAW